MKTRPTRLALYGIVFLTTAWWQPLRPVIVFGHSMQPTYLMNEIVLSTTSINTIKRGDVIVFRIHGESFVKRVRFIAGDSFVEYKPLRADTWIPYESDTKQNKGNLMMRRVMVAQGTVYVVGDNFCQSVDSRTFGAIDTDAITNVVLDRRITEEPFYFANANFSSLKEVVVKR